MKPMRVISKIDYKNGYVIKGRRYEGFKKVGPVREIVENYYKAGAKEFVFYDCVAALFGMSKMLEQVVGLSKRIFAPITAGGGIRTYEQARTVFENGADRIAINSSLFGSSGLVEEVANNYGSQSIVAMLEAKKIADDWLLFKELGREPLGLSLKDGLEICEDYGIGETNITAIDYDGLGSGFPTDLCEIIPEKYPVPVVLGGGIGEMHHIQKIQRVGYPWLSGLSIGSMFHKDLNSIHKVNQSVFGANK